MLDRIAFDDSEKKVTIYNMADEIIKTYNIGECFVDFMNINFDQYNIFYEDLRKAVYPNNEDDYLIMPDELSEETIDAFFAKYPKILDFLRLKIERTNYAEYKDLVDKEYYISLWLRENLYSRISFNFLSWDIMFYCNAKELNVENIDEIRKHIYIMLLYDSDEEKNVLEYSNFYLAKSRFITPFKFCFDTEFNSNLNELTAAERYYLYTQIEKIDILGFLNTTMSYAYLENKIDDILKPPKTDINDWINNKINTDVINKIKEKRPSLKQLFETKNIEAVLYAEFFKMLSLDLKAMKCKNCGKYFILKGMYNTKYCDRIPEGEKYTCQKLAALKKQKNKIKNNPILREYQKAYKRNYARRTNGRMDKDEFIIWVDEATIERDRTAKIYKQNPNNKIVEEFKKYLGNK